MKTIGLIGGMSWESTVTYYQVINDIIKQTLGGLHSAKCILFSVDFQEIEHCQATDNWSKSAEILTTAAQSLQKAGAEFIVICTNTMHKVVPDIQPHISIPILHIAEMTATTLQANQIKKVALLGTKYTMEQDFYKNIIIEHDIEVIIPESSDRKLINDIIYNELCLGIITPKAKNIYLGIVNKLLKLNIEGVILGCTEIGLLLKQSDTPIPLFDTSLIHAKNAALFALK